MFINPNSIASFAFRSGASFIGGKPAADVLRGTLGEMVFFFRPKYLGNQFFQWIRINFDSAVYRETSLNWRGQSWEVVFLRIPQKIDKKFLLPFRRFAKTQTNFINYF